MIDIFKSFGYLALGQNRGYWAYQAAVGNTTEFGLEGWGTADMWFLAPE